MLRSLAVLLLLTALAPAWPFATGLLYEDMSKTAPDRELKVVPVLPGAPEAGDLPRVDLSDELPPVGNQQNQNSCAAWGMGYYHRSQLEYRERHWDLTDPNHQFSPSFIYNQVNGGGDVGCYPGQILDLVCDQGCASLADCPFNPNDFWTWPSESAYARAAQFRCRDWAWFPTRDSAELLLVKQLLSNGSTVTLGIWAWHPYFWNIGNYNNIYCVEERNGSVCAAHLVTIVGYDDTLTTPDGPGAFRVVNSWGPGWGDSGFFWMSYRAVTDVAMSFRQAWVLYDTIGYEPQLLARVRLEHSTRDRVGIRFAVGPGNWPLWEKEFRAWRLVRSDIAFPPTTIVFDLTEAADLIAGQQADSIYVCCQDEFVDGSDGDILSSSAQYVPWCNIYSSDATPVPIPDNGSVARAGEWLRQYDTDVGVSHVLSPPHVVEPDSSYLPQAVVWNCGTSPASFRVRLSIGTGYSDSTQVTALVPSETTLVSFRTWTAPGSGDQVVRCSTALAGDEYPANDLASYLCRVRYYDVEVLEILVPPDTVDSGVGVQPQVRIRNNGTQTASVTPYFRIPDENYQRTCPLSVMAESTVVATFAPWTPELPGLHTMSCTLMLGGGANDTNDILRGSVFVRTGAGISELAEAWWALRKLPAVVRASLVLPDKLHAVLLDITGRNVADLTPGPNDIRHISPGVYFIHQPTSDSKQLAGVRKVIVTR